MISRSASTFVQAFSDVDATELAETGLSTAWQVVLGVSAGLVLIALALAVGVVVQRHGNARDEARKASLRAEAEAVGAVSFTELDLSEDADFDMGVPAPPAAAPSAPALEIPEYL